MGRVKVKNAVKTNLVDEYIKNYKVSNQLIAIWTEVNYSQVSSWRSNASQPSEENLNQLGELFEKDNALLKINHQTRRNTGLAKALDEELKRLMKIEKIPFEIKTKNSNDKSDNDSEADSTQSKKSTKTINPLLVKKIKAFAEEYKKNNPSTPLTYFDKPLAKITKDQLKGLELFICSATTKSGPDVLNYQVVHVVNDNTQVVANFAKLVDAQNYVDLIQRGYVGLSEK